jgi:hypothetical protein
MSDYEKEYAEFWADIVENEDGTLNLDQIKRELSDYSTFMGEASKVYDALTGSLVSKPNARAFAVISAAEEQFQKHQDVEMAEHARAIADIFDGVAQIDVDHIDMYALRDQILGVLGVQADA